MFFSFTLLAKILGFMIFLYLAAGLLVELEWKLSLRLVLALTIGSVIVGMLPWEFVSPEDPVNPVSLLTADINALTLIVLVLLSLAAVALTFFSCSPYSFEFASVTIPAGLAIWALKSGQMANLLQNFSELEQRTGIYSSLRWEVLFWAALIMLGILAAAGLKKVTSKGTAGGRKWNFSTSYITNTVLGVVFGVIITEFALRIFARDVSYSDGQIGSVLAQPAGVQIAFAVLLSFGIAGFLVKTFLEVNYLWLLVSAAALLFLGYTNYINGEEITYITKSWSAVFFPSAVNAVTPLEIMSFSALGSAAGYWLSVRYKLWKDKQNQ